jgi:hypothetical protein
MWEHLSLRAVVTIIKYRQIQGNTFSIFLVDRLAVSLSISVTPWYSPVLQYK